MSLPRLDAILNPRPGFGLVHVLGPPFHSVLRPPPFTSPLLPVSEPFPAHHLFVLHLQSLHIPAVPCLARASLRFPAFAVPSTPSHAPDRACSVLQ